MKKIKYVIIFITTSVSVNNTILNGVFGETWADVYLKIVSSNAESAGGTFLNHKMPVSSLPSNRHTLPLLRNESTIIGKLYDAGWNDNATGNMNLSMYINYENEKMPTIHIT